MLSTASLFMPKVQGHAETTNNITMIDVRLCKWPYFGDKTDKIKKIAIFVVTSFARETVLETEWRSK